MTIETRGTIDLTDIKAIEYECGNCKATVVRLLHENHKVPATCGNCNETWFADGSRDHRDMKGFVDILRDFPQSSVHAHVRVKLEIGGLAEQGIKQRLASNPQRSED